MPGVKTKRKRKKINKKREDFKHSPEIEKGLLRKPPEASGSVPKANEAGKKLKLDAIEAFRSSKALDILVLFFNMERPEWLLPYGFSDVMNAKETGDEETDKRIEHEKARMHNRVVQDIRDDFKFALGWISKVIPKEVGIFGAIQHGHTLASMSKRAFTETKPPELIETVKKKRRKEFYEASDGEIENEVQREMAEYYEE